MANQKIDKICKDLGIFNDPFGRFIPVIPGRELIEFIVAEKSYSMKINPSKKCFSMHELDENHQVGRPCFIAYPKTKKIVIVTREGYLHKEKRPNNGLR